MPRIIRDILRDDLPPRNTNVIWFNTNDDKFYAYTRGKWSPIKCNTEDLGKVLKESKYEDTTILNLITN